MCVAPTVQYTYYCEIALKRFEARCASGAPIFPFSGVQISHTLNGVPHTEFRLQIHRILHRLTTQLLTSQLAIERCVHDTDPFAAF